VGGDGSVTIADDAIESTTPVASTRRRSEPLRAERSADVVAPPRPGPLERARGLFRQTDGPRLRDAVGGVGWYPLAIVCTLNFVDELDHAVVAVFAPNIRRHFDLTNAELGAVVGLHLTLLILAAVPIGYLSTKHDRTSILRWSAAVWSACSFATAFALRLPVFLLARLGTGIGKASVDPVGKSLLTDMYPPQAWNRVLAVHNAANPFGNIVGPALVGIYSLFVSGDTAWRWAFPLLTIPTVIALVQARRLREPESQMVKTLTAQALTVTMAPSDLRFKQAVGRLLRIPTLRSQIVGIGVLGFGLVGVLVFASVLLEEEFGVGEGGRAVINGILATASLAGTLLGGRVGERLFEASPSRSVRLVGTSIALFSVILAGAVFMPNVTAFVIVLWLGILAVSVAVSPLGAALTSVSPPRLRPLMFSLLGVLIGVFGGLLGLIWVGAVTDAAGIRIGLASVAPFGVLGGLLMGRGARTVERDIEAVAHGG
jgi:MFS family permease